MARNAVQQQVAPRPTNLPALSRPTPAVKIAELEKSSHELEKLDVDQPARILNWARQMDVMASSVLAGFVGGAVGSTAGVTFGGIAIAGFALPAVAITGPLGMAVGVAVALLAWRGPKRWHIEKLISNTRLLLAEIDERMDATLKQIDALPRNAPQATRDNLWVSFNQLLHQRRTIEDSYTQDWTRLNSPAAATR
jgi:hypothetical protein